MLTAKAPTLREALDKAIEQGLLYLILDGTLIVSDRYADRKPAAKGKTSTSRTPEGATPRRERAGADAPGGVPLWASEVRPGSTHDLTAPASWSCRRPGRT